MCNAHPHTTTQHPPSCVMHIHTPQHPPSCVMHIHTPQHPPSCVMHIHTPQHPPIMCNAHPHTTHPHTTHIGGANRNDEANKESMLSAPCYLQRWRSPPGSL